MSRFARAATCSSLWLQRSSSEAIVLRGDANREPRTDTVLATHPECDERPGRSRSGWSHEADSWHQFLVATQCGTWR